MNAAAGAVHVLHPGDVALAERGERLETLLGSCVAIVLTDPRRTIGVMCHIVHSRPSLGRRPESGAYADVALAAMFRLLRQRGITPGLCEAFVYGGGNMFPGLVGNTTHVGADNVRWALDALALARIRVLLHDLGGHAYRRLAWTVGNELPHITAVQIEARAA